jgi:hypothetical protein
MTMFDGNIAGVSHLFGPRRKVASAVARRRRNNPVLWALGPLILAGYLMIGHPAPTVVTTFLHASAAQEESIRSSMTDVLNAALGTVLAAGWLIAGAWVGIRSARIPPEERAADATTTAYAKRTAYDRLPIDR